MEPLEIKRANSANGQSAKSIHPPGDERPAVEDEDFDGCELKQYALEKKMTPEQVWEKIKSGQLLARCHQGRMYILEDFTKVDSVLRNVKTKVSMPTPILTEPPLRRYEPEATSVAGAQQAKDSKEDRREENDISSSVEEQAFERFPVSGGYLASRPVHNPPEIALLLDHLGLAKEENKDILKLTQDAIGQITSMTNAMLSLKDELLHAKDEQLKMCKQELGHKESQLNKLRQEVEDLKILTQVLSHEV